MADSATRPRATVCRCRGTDCPVGVTISKSPRTRSGPSGQTTMLSAGVEGAFGSCDMPVLLGRLLGRLLTDLSFVPAAKLGRCMCGHGQPASRIRNASCQPEGKGCPDTDGAFSNPEGGPQ